jgi:hypothetical protein
VINKNCNCNCNNKKTYEEIEDINLLEQLKKERHIMKKKYIGKDNKIIFNDNKLKNGQLVEMTELQWESLDKFQCYFKNIEIVEVKKSKKRGKK